MNVFAIIVGTLAAFALGSLWYSPVLFGKPWMEALGLKDEDLTPPIRELLITLVLMLLTATFLDWGFAALGIAGFGVGALAGFGLGIFIYTTSAASDYLFCGWSMKLLAIQASYRIVTLTVMASITAGWN